MAAIASRQKRIRIADRHDLGWSVVKAYEDDELASGEEDAKCLEKAKRITEQKVAKKKKASTQHGRMPPQQNSGPAPWPFGQPQATSGGGKPLMTGPAPLRANRQRAQPLGPCWRCHQMGYLQASCTQPERTYPLILQTPVCVDRFLGHSMGFPTKIVILKVVSQHI